MYFMRRQKDIPAIAPADDPVHLLTTDERAALRAIARRAIGRAALAGALSGLASSLATIIAHHYYPAEGWRAHAEHFVAYWAWVGGVTLTASIFEIGFLYFDALRAVHHMACASGLKLAPSGASNLDVMGALARAALELPNPLTPQAGVDPRREASPALLVIASLLYKAKIALTTFIVKALVRSAMGRAAARAVLEMIAVPVTAAWNAVVCYFVLKEALLRIFGPSLVVELLQAASASCEISRAGWRVAVRAVASAVVRTQDFHPNHLAILAALHERVAPHEVPDADDTRRFFEELEPLAASEQAFVLRVLMTAAILDGRLTRAERRLLVQAFDTCQRQLDLRAARSIVRRFRAGQPVTDAIVQLVPLASVQSLTSTSPLVNSTTPCGP